MKDQSKLISIVIPAYNEEDCVVELTDRLQKVFRKHNNYRFEVIIVENGSTDSTWDKLCVIAKKESRFKIVKLARNFRMDGGLTAGLDFVSGDACILMTADLQDPPEFISTLIKKWELGWENVYGVVTKRHGTRLVRRMNSKLFYVFASFLTDGRIPKNASDFRLVDRKVYVAVRAMNERNRFVRGLFAWSGFKSIGVPMERPPRFGGKSNAQTFKVLDLAFKGIFAHSYKPLRIITLVGGASSILSFTALVPLSLLWFYKGVPFAGFGTIVGIILLFVSIQFVVLGIMGEYIGLIYEEVKQRPNYIVSEVFQQSKSQKKLESKL